MAHVYKKNLGHYSLYDYIERSFNNMAGIVVTITCPVCGKEFPKKAKELKMGAVVKCPGCGEQTTLQTNMFADMENNLEKTGKIHEA